MPGVFDPRMFSPATHDTADRAESEPQAPAAPEQNPLTEEAAE